MSITCVLHEKSIIWFESFIWIVLIYLVFLRRYWTICWDEQGPSLWYRHRSRTWLSGCTTIQQKDYVITNTKGVQTTWQPSSRKDLISETFLIHFTFYCIVVSREVSWCLEGVCVFYDVDNHSESSLWSHLNLTGRLYGAGGNRYVWAWLLVLGYDKGCREGRADTSSLW